MTIHYHRRRVPGCAQCNLEQAVGKPAWRERDRVKAKQRMRRLRAAAGGRTIWDEARNYATSVLVKAHRAEFDRLRLDYIRQGSHMRVK